MSRPARIPVWSATLVLLATCRSKPSGIEPAHETTTSNATPLPTSSSSAASLLPRPPPPPAKMVHLPGGRFRMGTDGIGISDYERPEHVVTVLAFSIDVTEVTLAAYRVCVEAGACTPTLGAVLDAGSSMCNGAWPGYENDPINCVTWYQATAYCHWAGKELPTEEMWELAARGRRSRDFPWGDGIPNHDWGLPDDYLERVGSGCQAEALLANPARGDHSWSTCPVGSSPKSDTPEGIKDLAANVSEWTASPYCPYAKPNCGTEEKAVRGGEQGYLWQHTLRGAWRAGAHPKKAWVWGGFRCVKRDEDKDGGPR